MEQEQPGQEPHEQCAECGARIRNQIYPVCRACMEKRGHRILLEQERERWAEGPPKDVALSPAAGRVMHLVLMADNTRTFCGERATQPKKRRIRVAIDDLPARVCPECHGKFNHTRETAAPHQAGGTKKVGV